MRYVFGAIVAIGMLAVLLAARNAADFTQEPFFRFGMSLSDADSLLADEDNWEIAYRIDTPSTVEIACMWQENVIYTVRFYYGSCYGVEKRVEVGIEEAQRVFAHYDEQLGETPEATQSSDLELLFSRWTLEDREISLTAYAYEDQAYMLIYEEQDPMIAGEAKHVQHQELESEPSTVDPITGQPRRLQDGGSGAEDGEEGESSSEDEQEEEEESNPPPPPPDDDDVWWE